MEPSPREHLVVRRRTFLLGALGAMVGGVLAACSQPAATPAPTAAPPAPKPTTAPAAPAAPAATTAPAPAGGFTLNNPPGVPNAAAAKAFANQKITYYGDGVGQGNDIDKALAAKFQADTGIQVTVIPRPQSATDTYAQYQRFFQGQSGDLDVMMVDVIWPGALAAHLVDLGPKLGEAAKQHYPGIVDNDTVDGKLVGIPWFGDFGMLYYRTDLLQKYGISAPPKTWTELEQQAMKIVDGEKGANPNFGGFVYQGNAYEGLTCDALEWVASAGGGTIVDANKKATINNPQAIAILNKIKGWVGTVSPRGVTSYQEEEARNAFQGGNAAFMRNWPYAYSAGQKDDSPVKGKFDVAPLPAEGGGKPSGTVGGWQLSVSKYSKAVDAAVEFVRYAASPEIQTYRAVVGSFVPTIPAVAERPEVVTAMPFLKNLASVERVTRPSKPLGERYNEGSTAFFQGVNQILNGQDASAVLPNVQRQIERLLG
jgi:trehalose/maltose transport system substrate-binding protein